MPVPAWASFFQEAYWGHFLNMVSDDLRQRGLGHQVDGAAGCVRLADGRVLGLSNLAQMAHQMTWDRWPGLIAHHFGIALTTTSADRKPRTFDESRALCKLRLWERDALPDAPLVAWDIADDLVAVLTLDLPDTLETINRDEVAKWPLDRASLWHLALGNVQTEGMLKAPALDVGDGAMVHILEGSGTYFAATHLLFLEAYVHAAYGPAGAPFGCLVAVPRRHTVVFHRIADQRVHTAVRSMLHVVPQMCHEGPGSISPSLYWWQRGQALTTLPAKQSGNTVDFAPPPAFLQMLNRLPPRA